jgi:uncharacterized protein (TIRG00374 family)
MAQSPTAGIAVAAVVPSPAVQRDGRVRVKYHPRPYRQVEDQGRQKSSGSMSDAKPTPSAPAGEEPAQAEPKPRGVSSLLVRIGIAMALIAVVVLILANTGSFDVQEFKKAFAEMGPWPLLLGMCTSLGVVGFQSLRWWFVTRPVLTIRYRDAYATILVGSFLNTFLPVRAGDVLRVQYLHTHAGVSRATLLGTELVDFWSDKCGWLPAFLLFLIFFSPPAWMYNALYFMLAIACVLALAFVVLRPWLKRFAQTGWRARMFAGATANSPKRLAIAAFGLAALPWIWEAIAITLVAYVAGLHLTPPQGFSVLTAFNVVSAVPVPGNVGLHEAASSFTLVSFGVTKERALAFAMLYHASTLLPGIMGGAAAIVRRRKMNVKAAQKATVEPAPDTST